MMGTERSAMRNSAATEASISTIFTVVPTLAPMMVLMALAQVQQAGVHEAHHHHRGGRGALHDGRGAEAGEHAQEAVARHGLQRILHAAAGHLSEALAHDLHPVDEEPERAHEHQEFDDTESHGSGTTGKGP